MIKKLRLNEIRIDGGTQPRVEINNALVKEYADEIKIKKNFPPLDVFYDGKSYWLVDGFHRRHAYAREGVSQVDCQITEGTLEEARWASLSKNHAHGLRRTNEDKREAVKTALKMKPELSDHALAEHCGVDHKTVATIRSQLGNFPTCPPPTEDQKRIGKDGKKYPAPPLPPPTEDDELFEKAREWYKNTPEYENMAGGKMLVRNISGLQKALNLSREKATELFDRICDEKFADAKPPPPKPPKNTKTDEAPEKPLDSIGREIPAEAMEVWSRRHEAQDILRHVSEIRAAIKKAQDSRDILWAEINLNDMHAQIDNLYAQLKPLVPEYVCPGCQGLADCRLCNGRRMVSKFRWDTVVTEIQKKRATDEAKKLSEKRR
jgi:hypothetical protein